MFRFLGYDRNGITTRSLDWLLKHKKGLRMRYNLHEVMDIGYYSVKNVPWIIYEIEQEGTWHNEVGHEHSNSLKRFKFDLKLLYKDLIEYGHDPHTHNYLGIENHAVVEQLTKTHTTVPFEAKEYLNEAIKYLTLRSNSVYSGMYI